jgi:serine/threonine protein kinase
MAPEILKKDNYGKPVDMWAFGVILYILICGYPPFYGHNDREMNKMVVSGRFEFHTDMWQHVSYDAKHLIAHLLLVQSRARYTVEQALDHKWIKEEDKVLEKIPLTRGQTEMRKFQIRRKLRAGFRAIHMITRMQTFSKRNAIDMLLPPSPPSTDESDNSSGNNGRRPNRRTSSSIPSYFDDIESTEDGVDLNNPTGVMPPAPPMI